MSRKLQNYIHFSFYLEISRNLSLEHYLELFLDLFLVLLGHLVIVGDSDLKLLNILHVRPCLS